MILNELFNQVAPYTLDDRGNATFTINGKKYGVEFTNTDVPGEVDLTFHLEQLAPQQSGGIRHMTGIEGTGDEIQVFGTVIQVVRDYISHTNIRQLGFGADLNEPSRIKLYDRMVKNLAPGWRVTTRPEGGLKAYILENPNYKPTQTPAEQMDDVPY